MEKKVCLIGGDKRNDVLFELLKKEKFSVKKYEGEVEDIECFLEDASLVVSGIPFSRDNNTVSSYSFTNKISIEKLFNAMKKCKKILAGSFSDKVRELAIRYEIELYDFLDDEDFAIYNAIPTAEGALEIAMRETKKTLHSSNCLILGYGRIGKVLADLLKGVHTNVFVAARKDEDFAWIKFNGYKGVQYSELKNILPNIDLLFNTVPAPVIKEELNYMKKDTVIIDLASKPGGVDFEMAKEIGIKAELSLGLPGIVAPESVSEYMLNKVKKLI